MKLNIIGVGYKAFVEQNQLILKLGFSHNIIYKIPQDITIKILNQKLLTLLILGNDFQKVNQTAAEIRALKPAEPYKGKGIKYFNEIVRRKEGKKTNV
jgi:large subunit ribosomal protein L6